MIDDLLNSVFTLNDLIGFCKPKPEIVKKWKDYYSLSFEIDPGHSNGRLNHAWLQQMICDMSNGLIKYGGQGKRNPDCFFGDKKVETKAFNPKKDIFHCAASSFFAKNCKVSKYRELLLQDRLFNTNAAKDFVFKNSYDKNDYYLLTGTANLNSKFEDISLILIETKYLTECLDETFLKSKISLIKEKICEIKKQNEENNG